MLYFESPCMAWHVRPGQAHAQAPSLLRLHLLEAAGNCPVPGHACVGQVSRARATLAAQSVHSACGAISTQCNGDACQWAQECWRQDLEPHCAGHIGSRLARRHGAHCLNQARRTCLQCCHLDCRQEGCWQGCSCQVVLAALNPCLQTRSLNRM
jgi:hypothetical protein